MSSASFVRYIYAFNFKIHAQVIEERTDDAGAAGFGNRFASTNE